MSKDQVVLNLSELDKLLQELLGDTEAEEHIRLFPEGSIPLPYYVLLQLRPLLKLADKLGEALYEELKSWRIRRSDGLIECAYCAYDDDHSEDCPVAALAKWQRAKGDSP